MNEPEHLTETELTRIESEAKAHPCPSAKKTILALVRDIRHYRCEAGNVAQGDAPMSAHEQCTQDWIKRGSPEMFGRGLRHG